MDVTDIIREHYDVDAGAEWSRIENRPEFLITSRFLERYIKPGDRVLDIGGGPGRYSIWLAKKGCDVTLLDLSPANVKFAKEKSVEMGVALSAFAGDAREADKVVEGLYDHVLLMGPLYHILEEEGRIKAVNAALKLLKPGGTLSVSFINVFAGAIYSMKYEPELILDQREDEFYQTLLRGDNFAGKAFTQAFFIDSRAVLPFMEQFPLKKLHFIGQEGVLSPCEENIMSQPEDVREAWLGLSEKLAEREGLLNWSEHLMYIGKKIS